jgi:hypothetical protein
MSNSNSLLLLVLLLQILLMNNRHFDSVRCINKGFVCTFKNKTTQQIWENSGTEEVLEMKQIFVQEK